MQTLGFACHIVCRIHSKCRLTFALNMFNNRKHRQTISHLFFMFRLSQNNANVAQFITLNESFRVEEIPKSHNTKHIHTMHLCTFRMDSHARTHTLLRFQLPTNHIVQLCVCFIFCRLLQNKNKKKMLRRKKHRTIKCCCSGSARQ